MDHLIGIDLGGTNIVSGLLDAEGNVLRLVKQPTEAEKGCEYVLRTIAGMVDRLVREHGLTKESLLAVGMGTPGRVNPELGICVGSSNLGWRNLPVAQLLQEEIGRPVFIDNDVRMYIYGEAMRGAGQGFRHVLGVTVGTGIASAYVTDGRLLYGGDFFAGEIGHVSMDGVDHLCKCGKVGCLETVVSAPGIARQAREAILAGKPSVLQEWYTDLSQLTALDISKAYDLGDAVAFEVMERTGAYLAKGLAFAVSALSPDVLIVGGGAAMAGERLLSPMKRELHRLIARAYQERMEIRLARWNEEAGIIGSALYAKQKALQA